MTKIAGIINYTPDSFFDGGDIATPQQALDAYDEILEYGGSLVDIGAESTRPGATPLSDDEEWQRIEPALRLLSGRQAVSLDTYHPATARKALSYLRSFIVNDVTGLRDPAMQEFVAENELDCIVSHFPDAEDIQAAHFFKPTDSVEQVVDELLTRRDDLVLRGIHRSRIWLDPGIGFGKSSRELNFELLEFPKYAPDHQVMIGASHKKFLGENRLEIAVNLEAAKIAIDAGAAWLRVHRKDIPHYLPLITNSHT